MSKLGLSRAKLASSVSAAFGPPPPDKKRKTDDGVAAESAWDDDLDILLTQNMNKLDSLVASTQTAVQSGYDEFANDDGSRHISASTVGLVCNQEAEEMCSNAGKKTVSLTGKRLIGHGSNHSRSADCLNNLPSSSSVQVTRKSSFSMGKSCTKSKENDVLQFFNSFQVNRGASSLANRADVLENFHTVDPMAVAALPMRLDANANCPETKLMQMAEECEYYKAEVCLLLPFVYHLSNCCLKYFVAGKQRKADFHSGRNSLFNVSDIFHSLSTTKHN